MSETLYLYTTLTVVLSSHKNWLDVRHLKTLGWMMVGLLKSGKISLTEWSPYVKSRAKQAQSTVRRFRRWLENERIEEHRLYGSLIQQALAEWDYSKLYLGLDTSMLWGKYCVIRIAVIYRGRAVPLVWRVIDHKSSTVAFEDYALLLDRASELLSPFKCQVVFLADRGFADTKLMAHLSELGWQWRIRLKGNFWIYRQGRRRCKAATLNPPAGQAFFWHNVSITEQEYGPVHLAFARHPYNKQFWLVLSSEPTDITTFDDYGLRVDIEENFLDDKSNGFQLESSLIRNAPALSRLCFVLAISTLYLVSVGTAVVDDGKRRLVDPHWFRGNSYLKIGWNWLRRALALGWDLLSSLRLSPAPDPQPAISSRKQLAKLSKPTFISFTTDFSSSSFLT